MILLTRPLADSEALAKILAARLATVPSVIEPLLAIEACHPPITETTAAAVVITSRHALSAVSGLTHLPLYCVGEQTAVIAETIGFTTIINATNAADLIKKLPEHIPLLYPHGEHITQPIPGIVKDIVVYRAVARQQFSDETLANWQALTGVVLCSARTAQIFCQLCHQHQVTPPATAFCFSPTIAAVITKEYRAACLPSSTIAVCKNLTLDELCTLIHDHYQYPKP